MSEFELFPPPLYNSPFSPIPDDLSFNYPMPLTPSDFGSPEDAPLYSPRSSVVMPVSHAPEKTHATSGVSYPLLFTYQLSSNILIAEESSKSRCSTRLPGTEGEACSGSREKALRAYCQIPES